MGLQSYMLMVFNSEKCDCVPVSDVIQTVNVQLLQDWQIIRQDVQHLVS